MPQVPPQSAGMACARRPTSLLLAEGAQRVGRAHIGADDRRVSRNQCEISVAATGEISVLRLGKLACYLQSAFAASAAAASDGRVGAGDWWKLERAGLTPLSHGEAAIAAEGDVLWMGVRKESQEPIHPCRLQLGALNSSAMCARVATQPQPDREVVSTQHCALEPAAATAAISYQVTRPIRP